MKMAFAFIMMSFFTFSQSNTLVVFSQDPTPFYRDLRWSKEK